MAKEKTTYPEIDSIKQDLDSLRSNVVELTKLSIKRLAWF